MLEDIKSIWNEKNPQQLAAVLLSMEDLSTMQSFLRDVMTEKEIIEISARFEAAKLLYEGKKYSDIIAATNLSSRTVARISDWLQNGSTGYRAAIDILHHDHIPPARAE